MTSSTVEGWLRGSARELTRLGVPMDPTLVGKGAAAYAEGNTVELAETVVQRRRRRSKEAT